MLVAENYLALKLAEAWKEIVVEFDRANYVPNASDQLILSNFMDKMLVWTEYLKTEQESILKSDRKKVWCYSEKNSHTFEVFFHF